MKRTGDMEEDFWLGLLGCRSTPLDEGGSPGELLQGRKLRSRLPDFVTCLSRQVSRRRPHHQRSSKGKTLPELKKDAAVRVRAGKCGSQGSSHGAGSAKVVSRPYGGQQNS